MNDMAECSNGFSQQASEINAQNAKAHMDAATEVTRQGAIDNQSDARAWQSLSLRRANNAATIDHLAQLGLLQLTQTGATENQSQVTPIRTATGDAIVGGVGVSAEQIAANVATLGDIVAKFAEAMTAAVSAIALAKATTTTT